MMPESNIFLIDEMKTEFYSQLARQSIKGSVLSKETAVEILTSSDVALLALLDAAYDVRKRFVGQEVLIHVIDNAQNGHCPEDCRYCAQAQTSTVEIEEYRLKPREEILAEAKDAYENGASCYCMVFAGRGPSHNRTEHLARIVREIKSRYPMEVCVSAGILDEGKAKILKTAGLDRLNHNLNTSARHYPRICTTHTYEDRLNTLRAARRAGLQVCSGIIVGMGETVTDLLELAYTLREMEVESIPVNFFIRLREEPRLSAGDASDQTPDLTPEFCLRVLCLFRFLNPKAEIRMAAGRELYLRSMQVMGLYPANSLFLGGYLNAKGDEDIQTLQMIKDAGFTIRSEYPLDKLLAKGKISVEMKGLRELRPHHSCGTS